MQIHPYHPSDFPALRQLFYQTVHAINARDYSAQQLRAWAPEGDEKESMKHSLENSIAYVAEQDGVIIGFSNMTDDGYIDYLFTHKDYQRQGVATALLRALENEAQKVGIKELTTQASITAKPFFEKQGFVVVKEQQVEVRGVMMTNFLMEKSQP